MCCPTRCACVLRCMACAMRAARRQISGDAQFVLKTASQSEKITLRHPEAIGLVIGIARTQLCADGPAPNRRKRA